MRTSRAENVIFKRIPKDSDSECEADEAGTACACPETLQEDENSALTGNGIRTAGRLSGFESRLRSV